jgi:GntR family transcriptional regulator
MAFHMDNSPKLNRHSPIPLHQQLSDVLIEKINRGNLHSGEKLPSENELMVTYEISRQVIRQALNSLRQRGLIYTDHGRGSFVSKKRFEKPLDILQGYQEALKNSGNEVDVQIIRKELIEPSEFIAHQLMTDSKEIFYMERVGIIDNKPENIIISYIAPGWWGLDRLMQFSGGSLTTHLVNVCDITLARSSNFIEVIFAQEFESQALNIPLQSVLLQISSLNYDIHDNPVAYHRVLYPGTSFRFKYDSFIKNMHND